MRSRRRVNWSHCGGGGVVQRGQAGAPAGRPIIPEHPVRRADRDKKHGRGIREAHAVAEISIVNPRVVASFMRPRAVCEYDASRYLTLTIGTRQPPAARHLCQNPEDPVEKMRVICPMSRRFRHQAFHIAKSLRGRLAQVKKSVRWRDRAEHFMAMPRPRQCHDRADALAEMQVLAMDVDLMGDMGVSLDLRALHPAGARMCRPLRIQAFIAASARCSPIPCRSMPIAAPDVPNAAYVVERLVDAARATAMTPDAIRRKTYPAARVPYKTATQGLRFRRHSPRT